MFIFEISENCNLFSFVKNDNIHGFFRCFVANFEVAGFAPKQKYTGWTTVRTAKSWPRKNLSEHSELPKTGFAI